MHTGTENKRKKEEKKKKPHKRHIYTHALAHMQPSGPDQYMTRVNLLRTSASPIKGLGVLIGDHKSQRETNNDVNPQQQQNGHNSLGLWEWRRRLIQGMSIYLRVL